MAEKPILAFAHVYGLDNMPKGLRERRRFRKRKRRAKREGKQLEYTPCPLTLLANKSRLITRIFDFAYAIYRPRF